MTTPPENPLSGIPGSSSWAPQGSAGNPLSFEKPSQPTATPPGGPLPAPGAQFELAGWGERFGAWLLDTLIRLALGFAIAAALFILVADQPFSFDTSTWERFENESDPDLSAFAAINLIWFLFSGVGIYWLSALLYAPLFMAMWNGATPGKRICGIRVIRQDGRNISFGHAFVREPLSKGIVMNAIGGSFFVPWLLNYLWPLWDAECRAWHDMMCSTRVVKG